MPSDNSLKPYTIVKTKEEIQEIMANFYKGIPSETDNGSLYDQDLHDIVNDRRNASDDL